MFVGMTDAGSGQMAIWPTISPATIHSSDELLRDR